MTTISTNNPANEPTSHNDSLPIFEREWRVYKKLYPQIVSRFPEASLVISNHRLTWLDAFDFRMPSDAVIAELDQYIVDFKDSDVQVPAHDRERAVEHVALTTLFAMWHYFRHKRVYVISDALFDELPVQLPPDASAAGVQLPLPVTMIECDNKSFCLIEADGCLAQIRIAHGGSTSVGFHFSSFGPEKSLEAIINEFARSGSQTALRKVLNALRFITGDNVVARIGAPAAPLPPFVRGAKGSNYLTKHGLRAPDRYEIGASLAREIKLFEAREQQERGEGLVTGRMKRPHFRGGHFRNLWVGPRHAQQQVLRWIRSTTVNGRPVPHDEVAMVHTTTA